MKISVLGSGNGARAWCAQIAAKGYPVLMWEPLEKTGDYLKLAEKKEIFIEGDLSKGGRLADVTMDIEKAVKGASMLLVVVPSFAHEPIFKKMIPLLEEGQHVVIVPGNFAAYRLKKMMSDMGCDKKITISCTDTMPYACRIRTFDTVTVYKKKFCVHLATTPAKSNPEIVTLLDDIFDGDVKFLPCEHVLKIDMSNANFTLHPFPVLLNYGDIEKNPSTFRHYMDGITPLISEQMELLDKERLSIGTAVGFKLTGALELLKMYYGHNDSKTIYQYVNSSETPYADLVGHNVRGRYITEDVPGVIAPVAAIGKTAKMATPISDLVVNLASRLHGTNYWLEGTTLDSIGIGNKNSAEIIDMME